MSEPTRRDARAEAPPPSAEPTIRVQPPPVPGRAVRAQLQAGELTTPPVRPDEPTVSLDAPAPEAPHGTLEFDGPPPLATAPDPEPRRRRRTWPWILAVVLALVVLGAVLLVMLSRGATLPGDVRFLGAQLPGAGELVGGTVPR